jgi:3D (Asp-Asp-Asp) domain-containing protein
MRAFSSLFATLSFFVGIPLAQAASYPAEIPLSPRYDYAADPLLLSWTLAVEANGPAVVDSGELSLDEKKLARWKEKQARLWETLEVGKRFPINASAYTAAADECGKSDGITASGLLVTENRTLACPPAYPFGAKIAIEGMGVYRCEDRGGAIKGNKFDIYMETKAEAFAFGRQHLIAEILE